MSAPDYSAVLARHTKEDIEQLKARLVDRRDALNKIDSLAEQRKLEHEDLVLQLRKRLSSERDAEFGDRLKAARFDLESVETEIAEWRIAEALKGEGCKPFAIGQRFFEWKWRRFSGRFNLKPTVAVLEVFQRGDMDARRKFPTPGSYVLRQIRKTGERSDNIVAILGTDYLLEAPVLGANYLDDHCIWWGWYPEGVDPNKKEDQAA